MTHNHAEPVQTQTPDIAAEQRAQLKELFPEAFTEGGDQGRVDLKKLRATLGDLVLLLFVNEKKGRFLAFGKGG